MCDYAIVNRTDRSNPNLRLRPMCIQDLDTIIAIERLAYQYPWSLANFKDCILVNYTCQVWQLEQTILGYGIMSVGASECQILNLCIHPDWQGQGLGSKMLSHLLEIGSNQQADTAFLEVRADNNQALNMYQKLGFNEIGIRPNYYQNPKGRMDALVLAKAL